MKITNLSAEPLGKLHSWLPHDLCAEQVVFLPEACPGKSPLPTGTAVLTHQADWRKFAVSDCGCGMRLLRSSVSTSRNESGLVDDLVGCPDEFDREFERVVRWAADNRAAIHEKVDQVFGATEALLDLAHNTFEKLDDGVIIRKGSVRMLPGELSVLPSHMSGDVVLIRARAKVDEILGSMSHGTGRAMSRSDCKPLADSFDLDNLRRSVLIPSGVEDASLRTDGPFAYRDLDECLALINDYVEIVARFGVAGYIGHL